MIFVTGYISLLCFLLMAVKYPLRKLHMDRANAFLMKLHEAVSAGMLLAGGVHMAIAIPRLTAQSALIAASGFASFALCLIIITACHLTREVSVKLKWHRGLSLVLAMTVLIHIAAFIF